MRVLHIEVGGRYGGSTRALELYLRHCDRSTIDHDIVFYHQTPGSEEFEKLASTLSFLDPGPLPAGLTGPGTERLGVMRGLGDWFRGRDAWRDVGSLVGMLRDSPMGRRLRGLIADGKYDAVHVNNTFTYQPLSIVAASVVGTPVVAHLRNPVRWTPLDRWLGRRLACLLSENQRFMGEALSMGLGCPVVPWYAGIEVSTPSPEQVRLTRESLAGGGSVLVASAGRLEEQKGYEYLVRAARFVVDQHPHVRFVVAGCGPRRPALERLIGELGLDDHFHLLGFRSDVPAVLAACDLFVSSSLWEGLPLAVLEAMLLARPVVATDVGGTREVVRPGETGILVPPRDPVGLALALSRLVDDPALGHRYASQGRELALGYADLDTKARVLDRVFQGVVGGRSRGSWRPTGEGGPERDARGVRWTGTEDA